VKQHQIGDRWLAPLASLTLVAALACGGSGEEPIPVPGFGVLSGQTVLVLPVQYAQRVPGGWPGGAAISQEAARQTDLEITFALEEQGGRATWVTPVQQIEVLRRRPSIEVNPYMLSVDEVRRQGAGLEDVRDPLYGEIRLVAALFDARYAVFPLEVFFERTAEEESGHLAIRTILLDARTGDVLWQGLVRGEDAPPASAGALASVAQAFAVQVSP
jgi:hypothetical protein